MSFNRRSWTFLFVLATSIAANATFSSAADRPNILFCFADDWGRYASIYAEVEKHPSANQIVKTPNIDRVARNGVLFRNAFVNAPSCTPCRSALLSGRYFFNTGRGAILQGAVWDANIPSFPLLVRDAGYHIGETWKVWSPGTPNDAPFGAGKYAYEKTGNAFASFSENVTRAVRDGTPLEAAKKSLYDQVTTNFEAFLADRPKDKPFLYWFGPTNVHRAWQKGSGKAQWGIDPDSLTGKLPKFLPDVHEIREDFADYLGEIQALDTAIGLLLKKLEDIGELDKTLIVISGDHGAPGFTHGKCNLYDFGVGVSLIASWPGQKGGRVVEDFVNLMDLTPTFLEAAGAPLPPGLNGRSFVNVLKSDKSGLVDPTRTWVVTGRERHVGMAREGNVTYPHRALRTQEFLYIRNFKPDRWPMGDPYNITDSTEPSAQQLENDTRITFADLDSSPTKAWLVAHRNDPQWRPYYDFAFAKRPAEELYDLKNDPDQIRNVAADPAYASAKADLSTRLMKVLTDAGDPRVSGDGQTFERSPFTDPEPAAAAKTGAKKKEKAKNN